jgi:hypothetical protein
MCLTASRCCNRVRLTPSIHLEELGNNLNEEFLVVILSAWLRGFAGLEGCGRGAIPRVL